MRRFRTVLPILTVAVLLAPCAALAQAQSRKPAEPAPTVFVEDQNAQETRDALEEVLKRYPPQVAYILKLDPSLLTRPDYLAPYPALGQFIEKHPEIARSPKYYFDEFTGPGEWRGDAVTAQDRAVEMWRNTIEGFQFLLGFLAVVGGITWIVKSIVDHRRWSKQSKVQAEVHNKLIDRLASNDEMLAYIQSPAGAGFLKAGPAPMAVGGPRSIYAPFGRILWSAQAGVVILAVGLGLMWLPTSSTTPTDVRDMLHFFGLIGVSMGVGFLVSGVAAYFLSLRLGLIDSNGRVERDPAAHS